MAFTAFIFFSKAKKIKGKEFCKMRLASGSWATGLCCESWCSNCHREAPSPFPPAVRLANALSEPLQTRPASSGSPCTWKTVHLPVLTHSGAILTGNSGVTEDSIHTCEKQSLDAQHSVRTYAHTGLGRNFNDIITSSAHGPREDKIVWTLIAPHSSQRMTAVYKWSRSMYFHSPWPSERVPWLSWCPFTKEGSQRPWQKDPTVPAPPTTLTLKAGHAISPILLTWAHGAESVGWGPPKLCCSRCLPQSAETKLWDGFSSSWHALKTTARNSSHRWKEPEMRQQKPEEPRERCFSPTAHLSLMLLKPVRDKADKPSEKYKHYQMSDKVIINYF